MVQYRHVALKPFGNKLKFGLANRVDQFIEYMQMTQQGDKCVSSAEWLRLFAEWSKSDKKIKEYLNNAIK